MAAQSTGTTSEGAFVPSVEETTERIRTLNEKIIESAKSTGGTTLDAYEKALSNMLDFENKVAGASQIDWISSLAKAHTDFVSDVTGAYTKAARDMLK
jgi:hypothetical protein